MRPGEIIRGMFVWAVAIVLLAGAYASRDQLAGFAGRLIGAIAPGVPISGRLSGDGNPDSVTVVRAGDGHFAVLGAIDEKPVLFLVDTGASFVTLTRDDARDIGINVDTLDYRLPIRTANGTMVAAAVMIDRLAVGPIERRNLKALVAPRGRPRPEPPRHDLPRHAVELFDQRRPPGADAVAEDPAAPARAGLD